jgi:glycolate oxidase
MTSTVTTIDVQALRSMVADPARIQVGDQIHEDYTHDELRSLVASPDIFIEAVDTAEVSAILRYANEHRIPSLREVKVPAWSVGR